jgi:protein gp37
MTTIEWCRNADGSQGVTWNPIRARHRETGKRGWFCVHASEGCRFCYSEWQNMKGGDSGGNGLAYAAQNLAKVEVYLDEKTLLAPLSWKKPRTIFVCSMTDLFGEFVPDAWIDRIFAVMALTPHTFQVLTKRSERMRDYCKTLGRHHSVDRVSVAIKAIVEAGHAAADVGSWYTLHDGGAFFDNIWLGVSAERQQEADERIPHLLQTPAAIRFVSCEPLLGPIALTEIRGRNANGHEWMFDALRPDVSPDDGAVSLDWIICGGESGKDARPMHPDWARSLRDQCVAAGVPFFFKQWGEWAPGECADGPQTRTERVAYLFDNNWDFGRLTPRASEETHRDDAPDVFRLGNKKAGRHLDGRIHDAMPARASASRQGEAA